LLSKFWLKIEVLVSKMIAESPGGSGVIGDTTMTCGILISGRSSLGLFEQESPIHWSLYTQQNLWRLMT